MKTDSSRLDDIAPDEGRAFLKQLDAALQGGAVSGTGGDAKALTEFAARTAQTMTGHAPDSPPAALRAKVEQQVSAPPRGVARIGKLMARWRLGVLDIAALLVIGVLSVSLYFALQRKTTPAPDPRQNHAVAGDGEEKKPEPTPPAPPAAPEATAEANDLDANTSGIELYDSDPNDPWVKKVRAQLQEPMTFEFTDTTVDDTFRAIGTKMKLDIVLDSEVRASGAHKTPVTLATQGMSVELTLKWICKLADLQYGLKDHVLLISRRNAVRVSYDTEVYDVSKTALPIELVVTLVHDWLFRADFADPATSVESFKDKLLVTQRKSVQKKILRALAALADKSNASEVTPVPPPPQPAWIAEMEKALEKPVTLDFIDIDLSEAVAFLRTKTGLTMIIDPKVMAAGPAPLTLKVTDMSGKQALNWMLRLENLGFEYKDHAIFIRAMDTGTKNGLLTIYNVNDIVGDSQPDMQQLYDMVHGRIAPDTWDAALGTALDAREHRLIVLQTPEVHAKIHDFLTKLRSTGIKPELPKKAEPAGPVGPAGPDTSRY